MRRPKPTSTRSKSLETVFSRENSSSRQIEGHPFIAGGRIVFTDAELGAMARLQMPLSDVDPLLDPRYEEDPDLRPYIWDLPGDCTCHR